MSHPIRPALVGKPRYSVHSVLGLLLWPLCYSLAFFLYHVLMLVNQSQIGRFSSQKVLRGSGSYQFAYPPLPQPSWWGGSTRVLILAPGSKNSTLKGELVSNLTIKVLWTWRFGHTYDALSYCWADDSAVTKTAKQGSSSKDTSLAYREIQLDGKLLKITNTLFDALQHIRFADKARVLWIDQICICQDDVNERNSQVQQMDTIYSNAESVIAWLGPATAESDVVLGGLSQVDDIVRSRDEAYEPKELQKGHPIYDSIQGQLRAALERYHPHSNSLLDFVEIIESAWFTRMWITQEAALAKQLFVQAGDQRTPWMRLTGLMEILMVETNTIPNNNLLARIEALRSVVNNTAVEKHDLYTLVSTFRYREATDPRDKIYGLLGLANRISRPLHQSSHAFKVDYSLSVRQVFVNFTLWCIRSYRHLNVLTGCCAENPREIPDLPLWAIDWKGDWNGCYPLIQSSSQDGFRASGSHKAQAQHLDAENALLLSGLQFDVVEKVATQRPLLDRRPASPAWLEWKDLALQAWPADPYGNFDDRLEAFWRTLACASMVDGEHTPSEVGSNFGLLLEGGHVHPQIDARNPNGKQSQAVVNTFEDWVFEYAADARYKRLFRTRRGYIGISCEHLREGDKVCILWGGRLPFILRQFGELELSKQSTRKVKSRARRTTAYKLIGGECYIHGLADGQGVKIGEREGMMPEEICLI